MCGIVGRANLSAGPAINVEILLRMLGAIQHRGPDEAGVYVDDQVGLGSVRLSIIDLSGGRQPIANEDGQLWVVLNGEIYNHIELRAELEAAGHRFRTHCDTEVLVHLYEERPRDWLQALNGQFAIALWERRARRLILARDRLGVRPLYYTWVGGDLLFASEAKALFVDPQVRAELEPKALAQAFTFWSTLSPYSAFRRILSLPPGHVATLEQGHLVLQSYWAPDFSPAAGGPTTLDEAAEELRYLLGEATRLRLRADVPVGAYVSGGLDSSSIAALARQHTHNTLRTFGIGFGDSAYDESSHQKRISSYLGLEHSHLPCAASDIAAAFPDVVYHAEMPLLRTSPAPMYRLARLVHESGFKVVLTGEGADELLAGYDIFKEAQIRRFWARVPTSALRPLLLQRLYPYIGRLTRGGQAYQRAFFGQGLTETDDSFYAHRLRWRNTARCWRMFSGDLRAALGDYDPVAEFAQGLPADYARWEPLAQAQYVEIALFFSEYLLSSQGDRVSMAHSVEGRYPFLDPGVVEFSLHLPTRFKLPGLREKAVLRQAMRPLLPPETVQRVKQPYRAPIAAAFFGAARDAPEYVRELLAPQAIAESGYFDGRAVASLVAKATAASPLSETEEMAVVGLLSVQWLHRLFVMGQGLAGPALVDALVIQGNGISVIPEGIGDGNVCA